MPDKDLCNPEGLDPGKCRLSSPLLAILLSQMKLSAGGMIPARGQMAPPEGHHWPATAP